MRIYATNSGGDNVNVIDPATNKTVGDLEGIEGAHGVTFSPDGSRVYVSNEAESTLDVFDQKTNKLIKKVTLSGHPNNIAVAKDGRIVVAIARDPGALEIIDRQYARPARSAIQTNGRLHNTYVTPDSKYAIMGSTRTSIFTVVDLQKEEIAWELNLGKGVRPMTIETNPDGSTKRVFVQVSELDGFRDHRLRGPQGGRHDRAAEAARPRRSSSTIGWIRLRTASAFRPTTRRCGSPASRRMRCSPMTSPT